LKHALAVFNIAIMLLAPGAAIHSQGSRAAAPPGTDLFLVGFSEAGGRLSFGAPKNITARPGYDNQPSFMPTGLALIYTSMREGNQADIYRYDIRTGTTTRVTGTNESEYSPTVTPDGKHISVIRVEKDSTQRLWRFPLGGGEPSLLLENIKPVGYHAWAGADKLVLFVLGSPNTLQLVDVATGRAEIVASNVGRSLHRMPSSNNVSFVHKQAAGEWVIKELDVATKKITPVIKTLPGSEDYVWTPAGDLIMAAGARLYKFTPGRDREWRMAADFSSRGINEITRLAVNPRGNRLAFVASERRADALAEMNQIAERYVKLALGVGQHDSDYVDAYYGPPEWQQEAKANKESLDDIKQAADSLIARLGRLDTSRDEEMTRLRHQYLLKQLQALAVRVDMLKGRKLTFDEESLALYDAVAPQLSEAHFKRILARLEKMLPGEAALAERVERYKRDFIIPKEKLDSVFKAAIEEARARTRRHIELPARETFELEYVTGKSWSGYNWYKGNSHSLIQINTDLPIFIDRAIDLACHEGYPGHHVYNVLLEQHMVKGRNWVEFSVYPLFSPQSLIAEGSANYGIEVAFPGAERIAYEKRVLFPLAGIDPAKADRYYRVQAALAELNYAGNEAARRYLNGEITREQAADWLVRYTLVSRERAAQRVRFFDQYRSYVINYNLGLDLVRRYIERRGGTSARPAKRWEEFKKLLSSPRLPSGLK
jgi:hypothetical protein